jgi:hypothetical protein
MCLGGVKRVLQISSQNQCVQIRQTEQFAVKISTPGQVNGEKNAVKICVQSIWNILRIRDHSDTIISFRMQLNPTIL